MVSACVTPHRSAITRRRRPGRFRHDIKGPRRVFSLVSRKSWRSCQSVTTARLPAGSCVRWRSRLASPSPAPGRGSLRHTRLPHSRRRGTRGADCRSRWRRTQSRSQEKQSTAGEPAGASWCSSLLALFLTAGISPLQQSCEIKRTMSGRRSQFLALNRIRGDMRGECADAELLSSGTRVGKSEPNTGDDPGKRYCPLSPQCCLPAIANAESELKQLGGRREAAPGQEAP